MGAASDSPEVRRLRYAFKQQGLLLRVRRPTSFDEYIEDDLLWTITDVDGAVVQRDVSIDSLHFMAEGFGRPCRG